ncbi:uncharacterized protein LOC100980778 isoform X2 [Pan paniscus]|uniref:uncharacterized protein LOC100980778 isoform X2 n=1 Tax=Pan paniscus TaxID=9597 RepID=UPI0024364234|nr:uncharacterized protein LOC100980778 isoform X2 [Pan paniscus]
MTPRRRPRPRAPAPPARAAREARRWRCTERVVGASARGRGGAGRTFRRAAGMAAQGLGPGPGSAAPPGLEAARQKLALRRKKVLSTEELELYELAQAAGGGIDPDVFKILVDLLKLNVAPLAVFQMLKSMCAGQRLASEPQDPAAVSLPTSSVPETRGTVAPLQGPRFPPARSLRPLRFCSAAQLPHTRLSLQAPRVPSASLAACSLLLQGEIKAALPSGEHWPWWNAAAARDPARGCHGSPALPGCPRGAGLGRALCRAAPRMAQRLVTSLSPAKATCYLLQLIINLSEMQRVQGLCGPGWSAVAPSRLTAASKFQARLILPPQPPE